MNASPLSVCRALPEHLAQAVWRGDTLGGAPQVVIPSGHLVLDAELPGGGWPCQAMTEILAAQNAQAEWRLLSPALAQLTGQGGSVLLIGPPHPPHLPGLAREGLRDDRLVRIDAQTPAERLWATEQALKARCVSAVLSWLPQVRHEEIRRLQACASRHPGPFFVFRLARARSESSAAPLRVLLELGPYPHPLQVQIIKRRGPLLERPLSLAHWPQGLRLLLPNRLPHTTPHQTPHHTPRTTPIQRSALHKHMTRPLRDVGLGAGLIEGTLSSSALSPDLHHAALDGLAAREASSS